MTNILLNSGFENTSPEAWNKITWSGKTVLYTYPELGRISGSSVAAEFVNLIDEVLRKSYVKVDERDPNNCATDNVTGF